MEGVVTRYLKMKLEFVIRDKFYLLEQICMQIEEGSGQLAKNHPQKFSQIHSQHCSPLRNTAKYRSSAQITSLMVTRGVRVRVVGHICSPIDTYRARWWAIIPSQFETFFCRTLRTASDSPRRTGPGFPLLTLAMAIPRRTCFAINLPFHELQIKRISRALEAP